MGDPVGVGPKQKNPARARSLGDSDSDFEFGFQQALIHTNPIFTIWIEGRPVFTSRPEFLNGGDLIRTIKVEEEIGTAPVMTVRFKNREGAFLNDPFFREGNRMELHLGYAGGENTPPQLALAHEFVIQYPEVQFGTPADNEIIVTGVGEEILLHTTERRRDFLSITDSDVAKRIAQEYRMEFAIQPTEKRYDCILQANETDYMFLQKRARLYGYDFYIERGVLHFHAPTFRRTGLRFGRKGNTIDPRLGTFTARVVSQPRALLAEATRIDPDTKESYRIVLDGSEGKTFPGALTTDLLFPEEVRRQLPPSIQREMETSIPKARRRDAFALTTPTDTKRPVKFIIDEGHSQAATDLRPLLNGLSEDSQWVVRGEGRINGDPRLRLRSIIRFTGDWGRWVGDWYVTKLTHIYGFNAYEMRFEVERSFLGDTGSTPSFRPESASDVSSVSSDPNLIDLFRLLGERFATQQDEDERAFHSMEFGGHKARLPFNRVTRVEEGPAKLPVFTPKF